MKRRIATTVGTLAVLVVGARSSLVAEGLPEARQGAEAASVGMSQDASKADAVVARIGDRAFSAREITAEFSFVPPAIVQHAKRSDNSARLVAVGWYTEALASKAAEADGLLRDSPGLAGAADAARRKVIASRAIDTYVSTQFKADDQELRQLMELNEGLCRVPGRYRIAQIGIVSGRRASEAEKAQANARMEEIRRRLDRGDSFESVANELSDIVTKTSGGEVGWVTIDDLRSLPNSAEVLKLEAGKRSEIFPLPSGGFVTVKMLEREDPRTLPFEECRPKLETVLSDEYRGRISRQWFDELAARFNASMDLDGFIAAIRAVPLAPDWLEKESAKLDEEP